VVHLHLWAILPVFARRLRRTALKPTPDSHVGNDPPIHTLQYRVNRRAVSSTQGADHHRAVLELIGN
jgi:hypothetical protein